MKTLQSPGLRVILADDEAPARQLLREELKAIAGVELLAECQNGFEAVKAASELKPDLIFLDIQMPKLDGFEVCELLDPKIVVIFVTAYDAYALKAFEVHAVDYLLKPYSSERLQEALARARTRLGQPVMDVSFIAKAARPDAVLARVVVKDGSDIILIPVAQLDYVEAQGDYVSLHSQGKSWLKNQSIADLETSLDPSRFVRIHRSAIVNLERVAQIHPYSKDNKMVIMKDGAKLLVSRSGYKRLKALWDDKSPEPVL